MAVGVASAHNFDSLRHMEDELVTYNAIQGVEGVGLTPHVINLDAPAEERFAETTMKYRDQILSLYKQYEF